MAEKKRGSRKTSKKVATDAGKILNDPNSTAAEKSVAASALAQRSGDGETPKRLLRFRATEKSPSIDIQAGEYRRTFNADDQPFEVETESEFQMLRETGHFVEDKEAEREAEEG